MAQKKTLRASERDRADIQAERAVFCERMRQLDAKNLVFLDESGITTAMTPLYARARRGERAHGSAPGGWRRLTVLGALSGEGMIAAMSIQAATTTRVFLAFLQAVLIPELRRRHPGATVLMDNLSAHKPKAVESALTKAGFKLLYLPRYSPDLSPIEPGWSKLKSVLRTAEARTRETLEAALAPPSTASPQLTHGAGSTIAVTRFQTDVKTALVLQPGLVRSSSFPMASAGSLLMAATPARPGACGLGVRRPGPDQQPEQASHFRHGDRQQIGLEIEHAFFPRRWRGGLRRDRHAPASPG